MSWQLLGAIIDIVADNKDPKDVVIFDYHKPRYIEVYPTIRDENFDRGRAKRAAKGFAANKCVRHNDLLKCLKAMDFDSGRRELVKALRGPIEDMCYFDRQDIAETFDFYSNMPSWLDD